MIQQELKQHLEANQQLRNAGASNDDVQTAALTYIAAALGNIDETLNRIEGILSNTNEHLSNIEANTRANS